MCSTCGREACRCLYDALASRDAELATLRARLAEVERERDEKSAHVDKLQSKLARTSAHVNSVEDARDRAWVQRDAALSDVARLTRERDDAREWAHSFAESAATDRDEALLQYALESGRRVAVEAERDEARGRALEETAGLVEAYGARGRNGPLWGLVANKLRALAAKGGE